MALSTDHIVRILQELCLRLKIDLSGEIIKSLDLNYRNYSGSEINEFKRDLIESAYAAHIQLLEYHLIESEFKNFLKESNQSILLFRKDREKFIPQLIIKTDGKLMLTSFGKESVTESSFSEIDITNSYHINDEVQFIAAMRLDNLVSSDVETDNEKPTPVWRLAKLLSAEKRDIFYIMFYAVIVGLISLVLPLGIQTTIELISGGVFFSSVYILIGGVIAGVLVSGGLQVFQLTLVEYLQRRIFTKAAFEFAYRIPRIKMNAVDNQYTPELVNRFFDVLTIQKGLPKFLIEFSGAAIQILFGLLLLALYHPFFIFFGSILLGVLVMIFVLLGPKGLKTSIMESKHKYQVLHWLEDLGRSLFGFKLTGSTNLPFRKTDYYIHDYLKNRKKHFSILLTQFGSIVLFKALIIGGLLIIGTMLVVGREITLGQFVASEVVIILILNSVEKIIMYTDVVYDLLTAVDKIGIVTDLPLEKRGGTDMAGDELEKPFSINIRNLEYSHSGETTNTLKNINLKIEAGSKVCLAGISGSGKTTLTNIIAGLLPNYKGSVSINGYSLHDLDLTFYRDHLGSTGTSEDIFDGTWIENISMGNPSVKIKDVMDALKLVGLENEVGYLPNGLETKILSNGKGLASSLVERILLARCLAKNSRLLIIHDHFSPLGRKEKSAIVSNLISDDQKTILMISNDPLVMAACQTVYLMRDGTIEASGEYRDLMKTGVLNDCIDPS